MDATLVKVGGGAAINLAGIASDLSELEARCVVVHGANAARDDLAARLGSPTRTITSASGVESVFTDDAALDILTMAYAGLVNKRFVSLCQQHGVNAIGLCGVDGALVRGRRNRGIRVVENGRKRLVRDASGKPEIINTELLELLLGAGYTPVVTVPILDEDGRAVNTENDSVVALLQKSLSVKRVVQLIEARGLLRDASDPQSLVHEMSFTALEAWQEVAGGRFRRKLMALSDMASTGCESVLIGDGRSEHPLRETLSGKGTVIR
jgi:acetylglutamate/LysW-gamma-L-alpha-aminoadipate kinase